MTSLVKHLHEFAREVNLTEDEWFQGIQFLTRTGHKCSDTRQEFILLSDTLGLSQLVVAQNHKRVKEATEQTVFGPFHIEGAKTATHGTDISVGVKGDPCFVKAQVTGVDSKPIANATVDVWHADAEGFYDVQDPNWNPDAMKLRAIFRTDAEGRFSFRTIQPCAYPIPTDGPVGEMLKATHRHAMRPAHIHFMVSAPGYDKLITHIFVEGDEWLDSDAVFAVRSSCIAKLWATSNRSNSLRCSSRWVLGNYLLQASALIFPNRAASGIAPGPDWRTPVKEGGRRTEGCLRNRWGSRRSRFDGLGKTGFAVSRPPVTESGSGTL